MTTSEDVIRAAASVGRDVAEGKLSPAELDHAVAEECRNLFSIVIGPDDAVFELQVDVARQVLERGGIDLAELLEWAGVLNRRSGPADADSIVSGPLSPKSGDAETDSDATDEGEVPDEN